MESTIGTMVESIKDIGRTTTCMAKVSTNGLMVESMRASTLTTKRKVMAFMCILTVDHTKDNGTKENSMARVYLYPQQVKKEEELGRTGRG